MPPVLHIKTTKIISSIICHVYGQWTICWMSDAHDTLLAGDSSVVSHSSSDWMKCTGFSGDVCITFLNVPKMPNPVMEEESLTTVMISAFPNQLCSCGSVVEHCVSIAKFVGSIPREHTY